MVQGQGGVGTFIANAVIIAFLIVAVLLVLRMVVLASLLLISPAAAIMRRIPLLRRFVPDDQRESR